MWFNDRAIASELTRRSKHKAVAVVRVRLSSTRSQLNSVPPTAAQGTATSQRFREEPGNDGRGISGNAIRQGRCMSGVRMGFEGYCMSEQPLSTSLIHFALLRRPEACPDDREGRASADKVFCACG